MRKLLATAAAAAVALLSACSAEVSVGSGDDAGKVIAPAGAPYSYTVPKGFKEAKNITMAAGAGNATSRSGVGVGERDLVVVSSFDLDRDVADVPREAIQEELQGVVEQIAAGQQITGPTTERVAGVDAFVYTLVDNDAKGGPETTRAYWLFKGKTQLQVTCQSKTKPDEVARGCREVLSSLTFT